ncbi:hypothetical protein CRENBAI_007397 [Crenichthys baileyi]|uniref:Uncharacterized protein n=1 Tax=Crenichthys baileyi TaxID=28760 RepID=A0AAV9S0Y2_9TELE
MKTEELKYEQGKQENQRDNRTRHRVQAGDLEFHPGRPRVPEICNEICQEAGVGTRSTHGAGGPEEHGHEEAGGGAQKAQNHRGALKSGAETTGILE